MELDEARAQRMEELKRRYSEQHAAQQKALEVEEQIDIIMKQLLDEKAKERLSNVKLVNRELYLLAAQNLIQLAKKGHIKDKVSDEQMKLFLEQLSSATRREIKIKRK